MNIIQLIESLPADKRPVKQQLDEKAISELETFLEYELPSDYKEFLTNYRNGSVYGSKTMINLVPADMLIGHNMDEEFEEAIPGMFVFGDNGGGSIYYYDPQNQLGKGKFSVFLVEMGSLDFEDTVFVGKSLTEVIENIIKGEDFNNRLTLGEE